MEKLVVVTNVDTRPGFLDEETNIRDRGDKMLFGCRSVDFLTLGIKNKIGFFSSSQMEVEHVVVIDEVETVPQIVVDYLERTPLPANTGLRYVVKKFDKQKHRWNDNLYVESLEEAGDCDFVVHFDQDTCAFRNPYFEPSDYFRKLLVSEDVFYVSYPLKTPSKVEDLRHASTRFFFTKRENLDLINAKKGVSDLGFLIEKFKHLNSNKNRHLPCLEHILGYMAGEDKVLYPVWNPDLYMIFSWSVYKKGTLQNLNCLPYNEVKTLIEGWGVLGANDVCVR